MKPFFLLVAITFSINSYSQIYRFRSFKTAYTTDDNSTPEWEINKVLIIFDLDRDKVNTYGKDKGEYTLRSKNTDKDDNGNSVIKYNATDEDGDICKITFVIFKEQNGFHFGTIYIEYPVQTIWYKVKIEKESSIEN